MFVSQIGYPAIIRPSFTLGGTGGGIAYHEAELRTIITQGLHDSPVHSVLLERSLLEIVHSPSQINAADLEQIRRRIDAAALLFKVRVMRDELRQREEPDRPLPRTSTRKVS